MKFDAYRAAWMARLSPNADGPLTAGDIAALVGIVGRLTRIPISDHDVEAQHLQFEAMQACRMGRRPYAFEIPFRPLRRDLGLREDMDLVAALKRLRGVRIGSRPAFDGLDYDRAQDTLTVTLSPGRQVVNAHPGMDWTSRDRRRIGLVHMSVQRLGAMRVVHSVPIIARLLAWHMRGYEGGLRLYRMERYDEAMTVTIPIDLVPRALGLVNVTSFRLADFKRVEKRIIEDAKSVGLRVTFKVEYSGRSPTHLGIAVVDENLENDQEYVRPERPPMPTAKREALPEAVAESLKEVIEQPLPVSVPVIEIPEATPVVVEAKSNVVAFPTKEAGAIDMWVPGIEAVEPDRDEYGRPDMSFWLNEPTFWPQGLAITDRDPLGLGLAYRHGDFAADDPWGQYPTCVESRYWRPSLVESHRQSFDILRAWEVAEAMRKRAGVKDRSEHLGITDDQEDGDPWDQPPPRSYLDAEDQDEGYNTHVDAD